MKKPILMGLVLKECSRARSVAIFVNGPAKSSRFPGRFLFRNRKLIEAQN